MRVAIRYQSEADSMPYPSDAHFYSSAETFPSYKSSKHWLLR
jgi:hypothetical protein